MTPLHCSLENTWQRVLPWPSISDFRCIAYHLVFKKKPNEFVQLFSFDSLFCHDFYLKVRDSLQKGEAKGMVIDSNKNNQLKIRIKEKNSSIKLHFNCCVHQMLLLIISLYELREKETEQVPNQMYCQILF